MAVNIMSAHVQSIICKGSNGLIVDIECHLSNNLPNIVIVGFANKAVDESRERIRGAFATSRIMLPRKRITVNLAPADIPKADSGFDLAIAVAILQAGGEVAESIDKEQVFIGELGLDGKTRAVRGIIGKIMFGRAKGVTTFFIPADNLEQAKLVPKVKLVPVNSLEQLYNYLKISIPIRSVNTGKGQYSPVLTETESSQLQLSEVVGQAQAKRALEIAAAGGHNVFFSGPPGTGKSMLAKALRSVLPPLNQEEVLEVTHLHSLASYNYEQIVSERPFRSPHHSASYTAITGGGPNLQPGEISLAHRGVLLLDELPEFGRDTLEALRQPLEDRVINIVRAHGRADYPANFILVATGNPCPCGYYNTEACSCPAKDTLRYRNRLSGPILDRIDISCAVGAVNYDSLLTQPADTQSDEATRQRITKARQAQIKRFGSSSKLNGDMSNQDIKRFAHLETAATQLLNKAARQTNISARGYMRTIKTARTIADLETSPSITVTHIAEAFGYRPKTPKDYGP